MLSGFKSLLRTDAEARAVYSEAAGIARMLPLGVAVPRGVDDLCTLVRQSVETGTALTPRGSGSSMAGGAIGDGVIVDLSRLREIGEVDVARRTVRVGPGALRGDVDDAARRVGLRFPPDPSSGKYCTVGGMASTNAAGAHTLKYGATRPWVEALDCVFDDGSRATIARGLPPPVEVPAVRRLLDVADTVRAADARTPVTHAGVRKESSGYGVHAFAESGELVDLLVGSEGTLALFAGVKLRLTEAPGATGSLLAAFASLEEAVAAATRAGETGAAACELLDRTFLDVVVTGAGKTTEALPSAVVGAVALDTEAVLLVEVEGRDDADAATQARALEELFRAAGATSVLLALTPADERALWSVRRAASPILATLGASLRSMQFIEDGAVPPAVLPAYVRGIRKILREYDLPGVIFGHAGDAHVHVNPLVDTARLGWRGTVRQILDDVVALTAELGGTLAGEHGDGRLRAPLLPRVWPEEAIEMFRTVKRAFDPTGVFNPGVKVALAGQRPIVDIKYDPALPPLPPRAAAALERVARDHAYHQFRLDLLEQGP